MAEALVIHSAVMYAAWLNVKSLMILSDFLCLVKLLKGRCSALALFYSTSVTLVIPLMLFPFCMYLV
ncbi:hypothetical protein YC2023_063123 [Brassica napus]